MFRGGGAHARQRAIWPATHQTGVEQPADVADVVGLWVGGAARLERRLDREPDHLDRPVVGDHDIVRGELAVTDPSAVRRDHRFGYLSDHPRGPARRKWALGEQQVQ